MSSTRIIARRFKRVFTAILMVLMLFGAVILMPGVVGAALKASHPAIPAVGEALASYSAIGTNPVIYNGGRVILNPHAYLIFEGSAWQQPYYNGNGTQTNMQRVKQYFNDVNGSALEGILTQYYYTDANNTRHYISNTITLGKDDAVWDPNFSYSNHCQGTNLLYDPGTTASPNDIADEITKEINANHWTNSADAIFFVFTPQDYSLAWVNCSGSVNPTDNVPDNVDFCGYHMTNVGYNYAAITEQAGFPNVGCNGAGDITDSMINTASHEQFEAITDPDAPLYAYGTGWNNSDCGSSTFFPACEIGDDCSNEHLGVYLNGTSYPGVQGEFSNATGKCEYTPTPTPTPTPTNTPVTTCASTIETDDIQPGGGRNPYTDNRGNTWYVYYDIKRDSVTNKPCQLRVVVRIYSPAPDGSWHGTAAVFADGDGGYLSTSWGEVSGSSTYPNHFVWRGPWFAVGPGPATYTIKDTEYNGSNAYDRAYASIRF